MWQVPKVCFIGASVLKSSPTQVAMAVVSALRKIAIGQWFKGVPRREHPLFLGQADARSAENSLFPNFPMNLSIWTIAALAKEP